MSLYFPHHSAAGSGNTPALHALIIGVGDYDHLGLNAQKPATSLSGLAPLTTTPLAAKRIARWLEEDYSNTGCPLGSIELLLSPPETLTRKDGSQIAIEAPSKLNIEHAFNRWYARCDQHNNTIAFFYFAGHGISTISHFLLPGDFGDPDVPDEWKNCIDFSGLQMGMAKCKAQTQLFFVDACRDTPVAALVTRNPHGDPLVTSTIHDKVHLSAAYFAASEGRQAYGRDGEETFFCKALISCLDGVAARKPGAKWQIDAASLSSALVSVIDYLASVENLPLSCDCRVQKPVPLHFPANGSVVVKVDCDPDQASLESAISLSQGGAIVQSSLAGERRPWMARVQAGDATIEVTFTNFQSETVTDRLTPPTYEVEVQR